MKYREESQFCSIFQKIEFQNFGRNFLGNKKLDSYFRVLIITYKMLL